MQQRAGTMQELLDPDKKAAASYRQKRGENRSKCAAADEEFWNNRTDPTQTQLINQRP